VFHLVVVNTEKRKVTVNHTFLLFKSKPVRVHEILSSLWQVNFAFHISTGKDQRCVKRANTKVDVQGAHIRILPFK